MARVCGVSKRWLQSDVNAQYAAVEQAVQVPVQKNTLSWSNVMNDGHLLATSGRTVGCG
jgi:hypothetical protein